MICVHLAPTAPCGTPCLLLAIASPIAFLTSTLLLTVLSTKNLFMRPLISLIAASSPANGVISNPINILASFSKACPKALILCNCC